MFSVTSNSSLKSLLYGVYFIDLIINSQIIPQGKNFIVGFLMLNLGLMIFAIGTVIYMSCELAIIIGMFMGAEFSLMTIYSALVFGFLMQFSFKIFKCNASSLKHRSIKELFVE